MLIPELDSKSGFLLQQENQSISFSAADLSVQLKLVNIIWLLLMLYVFCARLIQNLFSDK